MWLFPTFSAAATRSKAAAPPEVTRAETDEPVHGGYSSEELQASVPADQTAMLPYVDHDVPASTTGPTPDPAAEIRAIGIAASLVAYGTAMDDDATSRAFIQQLDAIDSPGLRAAVKARFQAMSGTSLEGFIRANDDWNDDGEDRDQSAALQLIGEDRDHAQAAIAELDADERHAKQARADRIASELAAAALAHDDSAANVAKIHRLLGGCDPVDTELVRAAVRRNFGGERNLYQLVDDGMDEADSDEEDVAIAMLAGDRVNSARVALAHEAEKGDAAEPTRLREIVGELAPAELAELNTGWFKYTVLGKLENTADRAELGRRIAGDNAGANAERIANLLGEYVEVPPGMGVEIDELNNPRREEDNVLAEIEAMSGAEVNAAARAWREKHPDQPFESMIAKRWGDDPERGQRLLAMIEGDKGKNRALRFQHAMLDRDQEELEAAMAHERADPAQLASTNPRVRARAEALRDEQASFERHNEELDRMPAWLLGEDAATGRSTSAQLDAYSAREARDAAEIAELASVVPTWGPALGKQLLDDAHDHRVGGREMLEAGELSIETRFHRADNVDAKAEILEELTSNAELDTARAGYLAKYAAHHGRADLFSEVAPDDLEDMTASELKIEHNRRFGVAEERPAVVRYNTLLQLDALQRSAELERDEADREGGGTQLGMRQIIDALGDQLEGAQLAPMLPTEAPRIDEDVRATTVLAAQARLDALGRDAPDGLRDGASPEDAAAIAGSADAMLLSQRDAKKRLAERKAKIIATLAKIAAALTANPGLVMLINLSSNLMQMAVRADIMGESYDAADDAKLAAIDAVVDSLAIGGKLAGREMLADVIGNGIQTVASGGTFEDFATGVAGSVVPGTLGDAMGGSVLGDLVEHGAGFGIGVAAGGDAGEAFTDALIGFAGARVQRHFSPAEPHDAPDDAHDGGGSTVASAGGASDPFAPPAPREDRELANTPELAQRARANLKAMSKADREIATRALSRARTPEHRVLLERALAAGDSAAEVDTVWMMSHNLSTQEIARELTGSKRLQHYQQSCVPAAYQVALADTSPRYAGWLFNNDEAAMEQQRHILATNGAAQTRRQNEASNFREALADPAYATLQNDPARFSADGDRIGIDVRAMVDTPLHSELEGATGTRYEVLVNQRPIDRIERALSEQRPVLFGNRNHEYAIVGRAADGGWIIHDPISGSTSISSPDMFAQLPIDTVTLPAKRRWWRR